MFWNKLRIKLLGWLQYCGFARDGIFYAITICVGALAGLAAVAFQLTLTATHRFLFAVHGPAADAVGRPWYLILLIPAAGAFAAAIFLRHFVPEATGSGIPQTKIAFFVHNGFIPFRVWTGKFLIGILNIGTGSSLGREGPTVQICAGLATWIGRIFCLKRERVRALIPVGTAAALSAAFNTPIAAITFTLEEMVGDLNARVLGSIVFASVSASVVQRTLIGDRPAFLVPAYSLTSPFELLLYAAVGVVCGLLGFVFIRGLLALRKRFLGLSGYKSILATALGGLAVGLIAIGFPQVLGVGYPAVSLALMGHYGFSILSALLILKLAATVISYGTGASGGIFAPSLFLGAMAGGSVATLANLISPGLIPHPGGFALVGMGAAFAAIIRTPMTSALIIFELTQDYNIILPLMVANTLALSLSKFLHPQPIYSALSTQDGVNLPDHETDHLLHEIHVADAMVQDVVTLPDDITIKEACGRIKDLPYTGYPIVDAHNRLRGIVSHYDLNHALADKKEDTPLLEIATTEYVLHAHPDQSLDSVMAKLGSRSITRLPVVSREDPTRLLGIITAEDVIKAFGKALERTGDLPPYRFTAAEHTRPAGSG